MFDLKRWTDQVEFQRLLDRLEWDILPGCLIAVFIILAISMLVFG